jgi:predicted PolB exonuclease-like 3'-5' exonuclease
VAVSLGLKRLPAWRSLSSWFSCSSAVTDWAELLDLGHPYFHRYTEDAIDLCDALSSFSSQGKATLHEISRAMGLRGKPKGFDGGEVERYFHEGKIKEIADYCETDVVSTYRVWLRYELFRGTLTQDAFEASERKLADFMDRRPFRGLTSS